MTPRKIKAVPIDSAIASAVKTRRESEGWTQEYLAEQMRSLGFKWARTTVTEIEGQGRGRQVSVAELLGLSYVLGEGLDSLLWGDSKRLSVNGDWEMEERTELSSLLFGAGTLQTMIEEVGTPVAVEMVRQQYVRLYARLIERVEKAASEIRATAGYLEGEFMDTLRGNGPEDENVVVTKEKS